MSLRDDVGADLADILSDVDGLGEDAVLTLVGDATIPVRVIASNASPTRAGPPQVSVVADGAAMTVRAVLSTLLSAIAAATGTARLPGLGDSLALRDEAWHVVGARGVTGDGVLIMIERPRAVALGPAWGMR